MRFRLIFSLSLFISKRKTNFNFGVFFVEERYEAMLKAYGLPITGDVAAKRAAVRSFIGCPE